MTKEILNKANALIDEHSEVEYVRTKAQNFSSRTLQRFSIDTNIGSIDIDPDKYPELVMSLLSDVHDFASKRSAELEAEFAALQ